jgi:DNA polymerase III alpha subunit
MRALDSPAVCPGCGGPGPGAAEAFLAACQRHGTAEEIARQALEDLDRFRGRYGYCKAHAADVAALAWQEAYLKARHPLAFWVGCLNHHTEANYPRRVYIEAAKRAGLARAADPPSAATRR